MIPNILNILKSVATKGGERGPHFDRGILHVISQIEETGHFAPTTYANDICYFPLMFKAQCLSQNQIDATRTQIDALRMNEDHASQYCSGILFAESALRMFRKPVA